MESNLTFQWKNTGPKNEPNLVDSKGHFLFSDQDIDKEYETWVSSFNLAPNNIIYVYGSGGGYPYKALKSWLQKDKTRRLFLLEPNHDLFIKLKESSFWKEIEKHNQVEAYELKNDDEEKILVKLSKLSPFLTTQVLKAPYISERDPGFNFFKIFYEYMRFGFQTHIGEMLNGGLEHFKNFYLNLFKIPGSGLLSRFFNHFKDIPVIVMGAGPSLSINGSELRKLKQRALIIAGGTAINAAGAIDIEPHLLMGIDPFASASYRTLSITSFNAPYIFTGRSNRFALGEISNPLIFMESGSTYVFEKWIFKELDLLADKMDMGTNVINVSLSLGEKLGAKLLILVGVDLAYSQNKNYAPNIKKHATSLDFFNTKNEYEEILVANDIFGKPVQTLKKWVQESIWYTNYRLNHSNVEIINSTEGGIGFSQIPNMPLKQVEEVYLKNKYDIEGLIHALRVGNIARVSSKNIFEQLNKLRTSLSKIHTQLIQLVYQDPDAKTSYTFSLDRFKGEFAYDHFLSEFDDIYQQYYESNVLKDGTVNAAINSLAAKVPFILKVAKDQLSLLGEVLEIKKSEVSDAIDNLKNENVHHKFEGGYSLYYVDEILVSKTDWPETKKATYFYRTGQIAAEKTFSEGLPEGQHLEYYGNGNLRSVLSYKEGLLDGEVKLYFPSGHLKRSIYFKSGKRNGKDLIYNDKGVLVNESAYMNDVPVGVAIKRNALGEKKLELIYSTEGQLISGEVWNKKGKKSQFINRPNTDYISSLSDQSVKFGEGLEVIYEKLLEEVSDLPPELENLKEEFIRLKKLGESMRTQSGIDPNTHEEPLWKTEGLKRELMKQVYAYGQFFNGLFKTFHENLDVIKKKKE
jgi:hypothetical protein